MRTIFPPLKSKPVFNLDFSLVYVGIIFLELSISGTELFKLYPDNKVDVILIRAIHTIFTFGFVAVIQLILQVKKIDKAGYLGLAVIGLSLAIPSLLIRVLLMEIFELIANSQITLFFKEQFLISLMHAFFGFQ